MVHTPLTIDQNIFDMAMLLIGLVFFILRKSQATVWQSFFH